MQTQQIATSAAEPTLHEEIVTHEPPRYVPLKEGPNYLPFTEPALRDVKFKAFDRKNSRGEIIKGNGSGPAGMWVQIGSKVLIDLPVAVRWIESHRIGGL